MYEWHFGDDSTDVWWLVTQTREAMSKVMEDTLLRVPVTSEQLRVLYFLSRYPLGTTVNQASIYCFRHKNSVLRLIERLEKKKLVCRSRQPNNKHVFFTLTDKGYELLNLYRREADSVVFYMKEEFSKKDLQILSTYLKRMRDAYLKKLGIQAINPPKVVDIKSSEWMRER